MPPRKPSQTRDPVSPARRTSPGGFARGGAAPLDAAVERRVLELLFGQRGTIFAGGAAFIVVAAIAWRQTGATNFLGLAAANAGVLAARLGLEATFAGRRANDERIGAWRTRFTLGTWATGILWGTGIAIADFRHFPVTGLLVIGTGLVLVIVGAARNAAWPPAARGQIVLAMAPVFIKTLLSAEPGARIFTIFIALYVAAAFVLVRELNAGTVRLVELNERNVALVGEVRDAYAELAAANARLEAAATTDALTGIANRRRFDIVLAEEFARAQRDGTDIALLMLDIDRFKAFNDRFGHQAGDACLLRVAQAFAAALRRPANSVARYGGEEFSAILPQTTAGAALSVAENVRLAIAALAIALPTGNAGSVTVSIGIASFRPDRTGVPHDLVCAADRALYAAKAAGRDCIRIAPAVPADGRGPALWERALP